MGEAILMNTHNKRNERMGLGQSRHEVFQLRMHLHISKVRF